MKGNVFRLKIVGEIVDKTLESKTKISEKRKQKFFFYLAFRPKTNDACNMENFP